MSGDGATFYQKYNRLTPSQTEKYDFMKEGIIHQKADVEEMLEALKQLVPTLTDEDLKEEKISWEGLKKVVEYINYQRKKPYIDSETPKLQEVDKK